MSLNSIIRVGFIRLNLKYYLYFNIRNIILLCTNCIRFTGCHYYTRHITRVSIVIN